MIPQIFLALRIFLITVLFYLVSDGGFTIGTLTEKDFNVDYGSAATAEYKPYITDINYTPGKASRLLRKR